MCIYTLKLSTYCWQNVRPLPFQKWLMVFRLPKPINRRHDTDVLWVQKAASPTGFPQRLLPRNGESPKPQHSFKNKGNICVLGNVYINDYVTWVGGGDALDGPQPYPMLQTCPGSSQSTPSHPGIEQEPVHALQVGSRVWTKTWLLGRARRIPSQAHLDPKTLIEMSHEGQVAIPHPQPKLRGLEIQVCKVSLHLL